MAQIKNLKIWEKKNIYFLCVIALNLIEFLRATGDGDVWKTAANCTGLVIMAVIICTYGLKKFLNPINYVYSFVCMAAMIIVRVHWSFSVGLYSLGQAETAVLNVWAIGLAAHCLFREIAAGQREKIRLSPGGWLCTAAVIWTVIGASGKIWPLWFYLVFGLFYLTVFSERDWESLWNAVADGTVFSFFIIQGYAYLFRPYDVVRYKGAFSNCNMMGLYYLVVYVMVLYKLHKLHLQRGRLGWKLFYFMGGAGLQGFLFMTLSRTAWAGSMVLTLFYGCFVLRRHWRDIWRRILAKGCVFIMCVILMFPLVYLTVRYLPTIHPHPIWYAGEYSQERVHSWDPADSEKYVSIYELMEEAFGRFASLLYWLDAKNPLVLRTYAQQPEQEQAPTVIEPLDIPWMDSSLRVRLAAAKMYLKDSTWLGHAQKDENYIWDTTGNRVWHSQNLWVQMTYTFGYPVGVITVVLTAMVLLKAYKAYKIKEKPCQILPILICLLFFLYGTAEIVWNPGQLILTLLFMAAHPQFNAANGVLQKETLQA